ncbi:MAG: hypothetical protein HZA22_11545 [Nitrospirae bacterium]|nr:hypothetical protein [Nitrospirota bacterium]
MSPEFEFLNSLSEEGGDRIRVEAFKERGYIAGFVVQYEAFIKGRWRVVVRYDTHHGFAHKDILHPNGRKEKQPLPYQDYNAAFTFAVNDIKTLWRWYRHGYEMEMKK